MVDIGSSFLLKENQTVSDAFSNPGILIALIVKNIYVIAGIILFFFIISSGLTVILNAGNPDKRKQGSKTIGSALAGFFILFSSYWIIRIIEALTNIKILDSGS